MKIYILPVLCVLLVAACGNPNRDNTASSDSDSTSGNEALYNSVMDIHDEVMPRTQDLYNFKKKLQDQITANPGLSGEEKAQLEKRIANLDSVDKMMMDWMHEFSPVADTVSQEVAREYLEGELERIKKVRDAILGIIEQEKQKGN